MDSSSQFGNYNMAGGPRGEGFFPGRNSLPPLPMDPPPLPPGPPPVQSQSTSAIDSQSQGSNECINMSSNSSFSDSQNSREPTQPSNGSSSTWRSGYQGSNQFNSDQYVQYPPFSAYPQTKPNYGNDDSSTAHWETKQGNFTAKRPNHGQWTNFKPFKGSQNRQNKRFSPYGFQSEKCIGNKGLNHKTTPLDPNVYTSPLEALDTNKNTDESDSGCVSFIQDNRRPPPCEIDPNLPEEISSQITNNACKICSVMLNSRIQSKMHYDGKPHAKKLKSALQEYQIANLLTKETTTENSDITVAPSTTELGDLTAFQPLVKKKKTSITDISKLYCKCCDLSFTSNEHATQHYMGRNHQRVLHGLKPLKAGYYNKETEKWQRTPPDPRTPTEMLKDPENNPDSVKDKGKFFCELCCVSATSQDQLNGHLNGQRHKKMISNLAKANALTSQEAAVSSSQDSILATVIKGDETAKKVKAQDLSIYRTPSGKYYCSPCDLTLNSECQFAQHIESKKHKSKKK